MLARFVPKHQHFLDGIALIHLKQGRGKGSLKNYAKEFQAKMVSCKEINEYFCDGPRPYSIARPYTRLQLT